MALGPNWPFYIGKGKPASESPGSDVFSISPLAEAEARGEIRGFLRGGFHENRRENSGVEMGIEGLEEGRERRGTTERN